MITPIAWRELLVASRRPVSWRIRLATTSCGLLIAMFALIGASSPASAGQGIFDVLAFVMFVYAVGAGFVLTTDCIGGERREGTFGLLYLTPLSAWDVIFGKLASSSLQGVFGLVAIVPMLCLSLLGGGVIGRDLFQVVTVLMVTLFLSLSAGIYASAAAESRRGAIGLTGLLVIGPMMGWIGVLISVGVSKVLEKGANRRAIIYWSAGLVMLVAILIWMVARSDQTLVGSPVEAIIEASRGATQIGFLTSIAAITATGLFYLFAATLRTEWFQAREVVIEDENEHQVEDVFFPGLRVKGPVGNDPAHWLLTFLQSPPFTFYIFLMLLVLISVGHGMAPSGMGMSFAFMFFLQVPYVLFNFSLARFCAAPFHLLERSGILEALMTTPLRTPELAYAQRKIFWKTLKLPFAFLVLASAPVSLYFIGGSSVEPQLSGAGRVAYAANWIISWVVFALHLETLGILAMWEGIRGRKPVTAGARATAMVMLPVFAMNVLVPIAWSVIFGQSWGIDVSGFYIARLAGQIALGVFFLAVVRSVKKKIGLRH